MWFITLIVLAIAAFLVIKAVKAQSTRKSGSEADSSPTSGLQGQLKRDPSPQGAPEPQAAANDAGQIDTAPAEAASESPKASTAESAAPVRSQQEELQEIREMIKILNLAETDSARLAISAEQFKALRAEEGASVSSLPSREAQADVADRLRRMLA